jgi:alcohol dehydrogenase (cytochrome c)/quinohemoprotein ethanol dehydrogenase
MTSNVGLDFSGNAVLDPAKVFEQTYGRFIAWDPVNQREVWRVERAGPANGGALATAGGLVFQGTGSGQFTALDAASGAELWSTGTGTGVIAAPITYEVDDEQYVALMVGTGGSWAQIAGPTNMKGYILPNVSRLLVYKLGGTGTLPATPPMVQAPLDPPASTASSEEIAAGAPLYAIYCGSCHGGGVVSTGILPDLRRSAYIANAEAFRSVVLDGALQAKGMASFDTVFEPNDVEGIRAYIVARANEDKAAGQ